MSKLPEPKPLPENWREIVEKAQAKDKRYAEWKAKHGWKDHKVGTCKFCASPVKPEIVMEFDARHGSIRVGGNGGIQYKRVHKGYHCTNLECGLMYKYCPTPITIIDENPWVDEEDENH